MGSTPLTVPPIRTALANNPDGTPMTSTAPNGGPITTEKQWWFYWRDLGNQVNAGMIKLAGLITYGNHADRPVIESVPDGALYVEIDRGNVLYESLQGRWLYVAGTMWGTAGSPDQRPTDLGAADVGFDFRTNVSPAREFIWSGGMWVEVTPMLYGTHAQRVAGTIANLSWGMAWMETDRGNVIYQLQSGAWYFVAGSMPGTLSPDQRPTDLGAKDNGFGFRGTDQPRQFIWTGAAWLEVTSVSGAVNLTHPNVVTKVGATAGSIVEGGITDLSPANSGSVYITAAGNVGIGTTAPTFPLSFGTSIGNKVALFDNGSVFYGLALESGFTSIIGGTGGGIVFRVNASLEAMRFTSIGGVEVPNLPNGNPGVGTKQIWYDPADGNRVKYSP